MRETPGFGAGFLPGKTGCNYEGVGTMKSVDLNRNSDGTWTARIFDVTFTGTREACLDWLRGNGESPP